MLRNWVTQASCAGIGWEPFFPGKRSTAIWARRICAGCPVRQPCLDDAMAAEDPRYRIGIWGGAGPRERNQLAAARKAQAA